MIFVEANFMHRLSPSLHTRGESGVPNMDWCPEVHAPTTSLDVLHEDPLEHAQEAPIMSENKPM